LSWAREIAVVVLWIAAVSGLHRILNRLVLAGQIREFTARKIAHVVVGFFVVPLAILVGRWQLAGVPIAMILAANTKANLTRSRLGDRGRRLFPLIACAAPVALILYCWSLRRTDLVVLAVLTMSIGDTAAALVGIRHGRTKVPWTGKTWEGAAANFAFSLATLWITALCLYAIPPAASVLIGAAAASAILEAVIPGEWDNPLAIMLVILLLAAAT
jgi:dolichol kinase